MKRRVNEVGNDGHINHQNITNIANYLIFLSQVNNNVTAYEHSIINNNKTQIDLASRVFECKTCNKQFPSFQALGGHRASHKKPKLMVMGGDSHGPSIETTQSSSSMKPKTHECSICGLEFAIGQALGGHMRRHRTYIFNDQNQTTKYISAQVVVPMVKKSSANNKMVLLDLNLTPYENGFEPYKIGSQNCPLVDCFL